MVQAAQAVDEVLTYLLDNVLMVPVTTFSELSQQLDDEPLIAIYALQSGLNGVSLGEDTVAWDTFYQQLKKHDSTQHVVGLGNTLSLQNVMDAKVQNIHTSEAEQTDLTLLVLYDIWTVSELLGQMSSGDDVYYKASQDLKALGLKIYSDNFQTLFNAMVEPTMPVGDIDPAALEKRTQDMWDRHAPTVEPAAYHMDADGNLLEIPQDAIPADFSPSIVLSSLAEIGPDDFLLGELPIKSGLNGPIGDIVDVLLQVLFDVGKTALSLPDDVMQSIKDIFGSIQDAIGFAQDYDLESPLAFVFDSLSNEFPFVEDLKGFLQIFLRVLFELRGSSTQVTETVTTVFKALIGLVLPSSGYDYIEGALNLDSALFTRIDEAKAAGKNVFDVIAAHITTSVLSAVFEKVVVQELGLSASVWTSIQPRFEAFIQTTYSYLVGFDTDLLMNDVISLTDTLVGPLDSAATAVLQSYMKAAQFALKAADTADDLSGDSPYLFLADFLTSYVASDLTVSAEDAAQAMLATVKNYMDNHLSVVAGIRADLLSDISGFVASSFPAAKRQVIIDVVAMVAGLYNDAFSTSLLPDLQEVAENLIDASSLSSLTKSNLKTALESTFKPLLGIVATTTGNDALIQLVSKTQSGFHGEIGDLLNLIKNLLGYLDPGTSLDPFLGGQTIKDFAQVIHGIIYVMDNARGKSFTGVLNAIWIGVGSVVGAHPSFDNVPVNAFLTLLESFYPSAFGKAYDVAPDALRTDQETSQDIIDMVSGNLVGDIDQMTFESYLETLMSVKGLFINGLDWVVGKLLDWLEGEIAPLVTQLNDEITASLTDNNEILGFHEVLPIGLGEWSLFDLSIDLGVIADFSIDPSPLFEMIKSAVLDGRSTFLLDDVDSFFKTVFSFFEISPKFYAELGVQGFDTSKNPFFSFLLQSLGLELSFSGSARFVLNIFTFRGGAFEPGSFFKIAEWGLSIRIDLSRTLTLLDFFTGGVGGGVLNALGEYIGLDAITITIHFGIELDIIKKMATAIASEISTLTLILNIGVAIHLGINLLIASISLDGALDIFLTFFQELNTSAPMKITLSLVLSLSITISLLFVDIDVGWKWSPGGPWDLSPSKGTPEYEQSGVGFDSDNDGLSDEYENSKPGLDPNNPDTDGDGAGDKLEVSVMYTRPDVWDTDGDGLSDGEEWDLGTSPHRVDSDYDTLSDYDEAYIYLTSPLSYDTDGDKLGDAQEVNTRYSLEGITPTVTAVTIGGVTYNDRTDPLNPDTDGDGLLDGDEGFGGPYYGMDALYNDTAGSGMDPNPLIFNHGYTHPLDADTDDDSYLQLYNGMVDTQALLFLKDMNDGAEVAGFDITVFDSEGEPVNKHVFTNPVNPDSDGDTGITDRTPQPGAWINSDGYELAQTPPTDPTDGDSDDDGLLDGLEGVLSQTSPHTNPNDPDTDDDGLFDMQELLLHTDPRAADSDGDMVPDGAEYYIFHTNPLLPDTDFDSLTDGEEVYIWHSSPLLDDSDGDHIPDGREVLWYGSDPTDEDGDNDGLTDYQEIFIFGTNPFDYDSDDDLLSDGEEALLYDSDPLSWDTDRDSIVEPDENNVMTWPMSDYQEIMIYGTNATSADTDHDGLSDALELYVGSGKIPWLEPIILNPLTPDTDGDMLLDGEEISLNNVTDIVYPYLAETLFNPLNTSPVLWDTDFDNVSDYLEVIVYHSSPQMNDTDLDTLTDWQEIYIYNTSAIKEDTDGDGLLDNEETLTAIYPPVPPSLLAGTGPPFAMASYIPAQSAKYPSSATDPDSDNDFLPDGAEVNFYKTNPMSSDSDGDGIKDKFEFDTDYDNLPDGVEFEIGTYKAPGGGFLNPDSDYDGLYDGDEYYVYGTSPIKSDTDGDSYGDGLEIAVGTNPLVFTSHSEFQLTLAKTRGLRTISVLLPKANATVYQNTPVQVANFTTFQDMWFRYTIDGSWSDNISLEYVPGVQLWSNLTQTWEPGSHTLLVYGRDTHGSIHIAEIIFTVEAGNDPTLLYLMVGAIGAIGLVSLAGFVGWRRGWIPPKRFKAGRGKTGVTNPEATEGGAEAETLDEAHTDTPASTRSKSRKSGGTASEKTSKKTGSSGKTAKKGGK